MNTDIQNRLEELRARAKTAPTRDVKARKPYAKPKIEDVVNRYYWKLDEFKRRVDQNSTLSTAAVMAGIPQRYAKELLEHLNKE